MLHEAVRADASGRWALHALIVNRDARAPRRDSIVQRPPRGPATAPHLPRLAQVVRTVRTANEHTETETETEEEDAHPRRATRRSTWCARRALTRHDSDGVKACMQCVECVDCDCWIASI